MGLLDDYSGPGGLLGIGMSPRPLFFHQLVMKRIAFQFDKYFAEKGFEALTEVAIQKKPEKAPDVVFFRVEPSDWEPLVFVEITTRKEKRKIIEESRKLMLALKIYEAFIYDYESQEWTRIYDHERWPNTRQDQDWCETFQIYLSDFLK